MGGEPYTAIGRIVKTHGLKGEVSVKSYAEASLSLLEDVDVWLVPPPSGLRMTRIVSVRPGPKGPIVGLSGISDVASAREIQGCELLARTSDLPDAFLDMEEPDDAVGITVYDEERGFLGKVTEVIVTGANDVWVVEGPLGQVLIPVIDDVVLSFDEDSDAAKVCLLPGLLDGGEDW